MTQTGPALSFGGGAIVWIFRVLVVAGAAFMIYSWFQPWWVTDVAVVQGTDDIVLHPWGVEVVRQVRVSADPELYSMPGFFTPFVWTYFGVAMVGLLASMFLNLSVKLGPINIPVAVLIIAFVGLSYMAAVGIAYYIGDMRATGMDINFIGRSRYQDPTSGRPMQMESELRDGFWLALYAGGALFVLSLIRWIFVRTPKA